MINLRDISNALTDEQARVLVLELVAQREIAVPTRAEAAPAPDHVARVLDSAFPALGIYVPGLSAPAQ